jgi:hypothetical protein
VFARVPPGGRLGARRAAYLIRLLGPLSSCIGMAEGFGVARWTDGTCLVGGAERTAMELKVTRYAVDGDGIATIWLSRPGRANSWTGRMHDEYRWICAQLDGDPAVRVIVLTGEGDTFCGGADFRALEHVAQGRFDILRRPEGRGFQGARQPEVRGSAGAPTAAALPAQSRHALPRCSWLRSHPRSRYGRRTGTGSRLGSRGPPGP